jgi:hypothetical protein
MKRARTWSVAALFSLAAGAFLASGVPLTRVARASVPAGPPVFSNPTVFTNPFFPFQAGGFRVFSGRSEGEAIVLLDVFSSETRDFSWGGGTVTCVVIQETEFEGGQLVEITKNYFAQANDGSVYYFGETVDDYEDGVITGHGGGWLVGGPTGDDPPETQSVVDPALFMPANPEEGDEWMPEDVPDGPQELDLLTRADVKVKVPTGRYEGCIEVLETDVADDASEKKWYAPGIGVCKGKQKGENFALVATTFQAPEVE